MKKTYKFEIAFGATGAGFEYETNDLREIERDISRYKLDPINAITVFDRKLNDFIYWKDALAYKPEINLLGAMFRDFRCKGRQYKVN